MQARPPQNEGASAEGALQPQQSAQILAYQREDSNAKSSEQTESDTGKGTAETIGEDTASVSAPARWEGPDSGAWLKSLTSEALKWMHVFVIQAFENMELLCKCMPD